MVLMMVLLCAALVGSTAISLSTSSTLPRVPPSVLFDYLATASNWPKIVLSSWAVEGEQLDAPLCQGDSVSEVFGLPPLFPLRVQWTCIEASQESGSLMFASPAGVAGIATECQMVFVIAPTADGGGSQVELTI